jgi:prepilin peptidase CpaA
VDWLVNFLVASVSLIAIITDARWHKIPNWLTFPAIAAGFLVNAVSGWEGLIRSIGGFAFALAFMLPFFALDLLKAGDVKLVVAWGTIKGLGQPAWQSFALWAFPLRGAARGIDVNSPSCLQKSVAGNLATGSGDFAQFVPFGT